MDAKTLKDAKSDLEKLVDEALDNHEPVIITLDGRPAVVLVSLADWNSQQETEHLLRGPVNRKRLRRSIADANKGRFAKIMTPGELDGLRKMRICLHAHGWRDFTQEAPSSSAPHQGNAVAAHSPA